MSLLIKQLLNESQQFRKKFVWSLQISTSRYRVRKAATTTKNVMSDALMRTLIIITKVLQNDEDIALMFIIIWLRNIKVIWSLMNNESVIEVISQRLMNKIFFTKIKKNENLSITLTINHRTTLKKYVWIAINCQEVKTYMKAYVCSIIVYDLLLELRWQKRIQMKIDMRQSIMSIKETNEKKRMIRTQLISKEVLTQVLIVKIKEEKEFDEKEALQTIINEEMNEKKLKERRWRKERFVNASKKA